MLYNTPWLRICVTICMKPEGTQRLSAYISSKPLVAVLYMHTCVYMYVPVEPEMADINNIVIPLIKSEWEDFAYALHYQINSVKAIKEKHREDPKKCCRALFEDWLLTDRGDGPKTWQTILDKLKEVEELVAAGEEIMQALIHKYD